MVSFIIKSQITKNKGVRELVKTFVKSGPRSLSQLQQTFKDKAALVHALSILTKHDLLQINFETGDSVPDDLSWTYTY